MTPTAEDLHALARSSPWRWTTLRFTETRSRARSGAVRAWLRRPDALRVESADGALLQVVRERPRQVGVLGPGGGRTVTLPRPRDPAAPAPHLRPDGLVAVRPSPWEVSLDDPMWQDYRWVAELDPAELADGADPDDGSEGPGTEVLEVREVEHAGRPAWEALLRPTARYQPRCTCCPLLSAPDVDRREAGALGRDPWRSPDGYPELHRVRLDVGTGVCVLVEELGGDSAGVTSRIDIEAVDEPMSDALFPPWHP